MAGDIILQDLPAKAAALDFADYADTLARIIVDSKPRFAIGIFGGWGSGKTTLMNAISAKLRAQPIVQAEFSAWRYEREPNLIVPLLDVVREALVRWAEANPASRATADTLTRTIGRSVKALLAGFAFKAGLPNAMEISYDASKSIDTWDKSGLESRDTARSLYHASFTALSEAFEAFAEDDPQRRIVVFVDDLDRCLPNSAIEVIEAMKLFFDLPGFVFVVGLDQKVIEAAVEIRYKDFNETLPSEQAKVRGEDYIKKIFQVPFSLAPVSASELHRLLTSYLDEAQAPAAQRSEVMGDVLRHLEFLAADSPVNPRDVKRYINAYTITKSIRGTLDRNAILAFQTMYYRLEWKHLYNSLIAFQKYFILALQRHRSGDSAALADLDDRLISIPPDFLRYIDDDGPGHALLGEGDRITEYIYAGETTRAAGNPALADAVFKLSRIRRGISDLPKRLIDVDHAVLADLVRELESFSASLSSHVSDKTVAQNADAVLKRVLADLSRLQARLGGDTARYAEEVEDWPALAKPLKDLVPTLISSRG